MTDNEIKNGLTELAEFCRKCGNLTKENDVLNNALDLINRQQEENENLEYKLLGVMHFVDKWLDGAELEQDEVNRASAMREKTLQLVEQKQAEIERLQKVNDSFTDIGKLYSEIKAEAIKEFAEMLCKGRVSNDPVVIAVKTELKEMVGDTE